MAETTETKAETKAATKTKQTETAETKAATKTKQPEAKYATEYYQAVKVEVGSDGDKKRTDLQGNPINF